MKKVISLLLIALMSLSFLGCGAKETKKEIENNTKQEMKYGKNFNELTKSKPRKVRNDTTGNWRLVTISEAAEIQKYALSYYKENFKDKKEIHAIVNFTNKTTSKITDAGKYLEVEVFEYVPKEEHDAKKLFSGMRLKQYHVYKDDGKIEDIETE